MVPKTQTNLSPVHQGRTLLRGHLFKPSGLPSDLMCLRRIVPRGVNPGGASGIGHSTDLSQLKGNQGLSYHKQLRPESLRRSVGQLFSQQQILQYFQE